MLSRQERLEFLGLELASWDKLLPRILDLRITHVIGQNIFLLTAWLSTFSYR
jgi:hypothetical protein